MSQPYPPHPGATGPYPPGPYPPGQQPTGPYPPGQQPTGPYPPGQQPTGPYAPGRQPAGPYPTSQPELRRDAEAAIQARRELGPDYDDAIAAGLADKVEQLVAYRMAELRAQSERQSAQSSDERLRRNQRFALGIVSLGAGIPITAISANLVEPGLLGIVVSWAGIVGVNLAAAWNERRRA